MGVKVGVIVKTELDLRGSAISINIVDGTARRTSGSRECKGGNEGDKICVVDSQMLEKWEMPG